MANAANLRLEQRQRHVRNLLCKASTPFIIQYYSNNNTSKLSGIDMILMDEQGTKIHATINSSIVYVIGRLIQNKDITVLDPNNAPKHTLEFQLQDVTMWIFEG
nr:oxoglutarate/iron-dependent dioxygenase [Tanacetum cinerariifolium]